MSQADLDGIMAKINAARSAPLIMLQCGPVRSLQEVANDAWAELGGRLGFDPMTVERGRSDRHFTAVAVNVAAEA
ncbi:hypothetical protein [Caulobacter sp. FWC2]|uniref:hypothetical protein n=1 Tax=Caulobacter sp. FWC2 TaxID=69664 RepID=UPI000C14B6F8|nr:hypothetical protein [Caulobacter sp. FWC2]PIB91259.1 hypothetical protein CSW62_06530 [Caulobacter sp. FWC2]